MAFWNTPLVHALVTPLAAALLFAAPAAAEDAGAPEIPAGAGVDFTKLRMDFANRKDYSPTWDNGEERDAIIAAYRAKDYAKCAELSKPWLERVPVDASIHMVRSLSLQRLGDMAGACRHRYCYYGLLHSITSSGDGRTAKTAYKVISVGEEYVVLNEMGAEVTQQSLAMPCDVMQVRTRDGAAQTIYFDVSISMAALSRQLDPANQKK